MIVFFKLYFQLTEFNQTLQEFAKDIARKITS